LGILGHARAVPARLAREPHPLRFVASRALWWGRLSRRFVITFPEGFRLRFHPSAMAAQLWTDTNHNRDDRELLAALLQPGDVVVDVGANIGALTVAVAWAVGPEGHVYAIEANPTTFAHLQENVEFNELTNVTCLQYAASSDTVPLGFSDNARSDTMNMVDATGPLTVPAAPLDALIPQEIEVALLKIDVEGYERFVLEGAPSTLARTRQIYIEVWDHHFERFGYRTEDVLHALSDAGFETHRLGDGSRLLGIEGAGAECENLLAIRK